MLFKEILSNKETIIYHGSDTVVNNPKIIQPVRALDFGSGFYTTTNLDQAKSFAKKVMNRNKTSETHISAYIINIDIFKKLKHGVFNKPDKKWLDFVSANRNEIYSGESYDIIYGPVANDTIFRIFIAYQNGILSEAETLKRLKIRRLYNQLVFCTENALKCLIFSGEIK